MKTGLQKRRGGGWRDTAKGRRGRERDEGLRGGQGKGREGAEGTGKVREAMEEER